MKDKERVESHLINMDGVMKERQSLTLRKDNKLALRAFRRIVAMNIRLLEQIRDERNK